VDVVGFDDGDVPEIAVSSRLTLAIPGKPKIDSKALVVLGSGSVDAVPGVPFPAAGDEVSPVVGEGEGWGHLWGLRKKNGGVFDSGQGNGRGGWRPSRLGLPRRFFLQRPVLLVGIVIVQVPEQVRGLHDVGPPEVVPVNIRC
jgi:hypothetical protein